MIATSSEISGGGACSENDSIKCFTVPTVTVEYLCRVSEKISLGCSVSFGTPRLIVGDKNNVAFMYGSIQSKFRKFCKSYGRVNLFLGAGVGIELLNCHGGGRNDFYHFFSWQLTTTGFQFSFDRMLLEAEFTIGSEGLVLTAGLGVKF